MKQSGSPPPVKFNLTPSQISALAEKLVQRANHGTNEITSSVGPHEATFENTLLPLSQVENEIRCEVEVIVLLENVSPSAEIRAAAAEAFKAIQGALGSIYKFEAIFALVDAVVKKQDPQALDEESERLLSDTHVACINMGLKLPAEERHRFEQMMERGTDLRATFIKNLAADPGSLWVHEHELEGMSRAMLDDMEQDEDGRRLIPLRTPMTSKVLSKCSNEETRKKVFLAKEYIHSDNAPLFRETILSRDESARMLGYSSYSHQLVSRRMMKSPEAVLNLLHDLSTKLRPLVESELKALGDLRADGGAIHFWDFHYYHDIMLQGHNVSGELIAEYFPADFVLRRMLDIFEKLFHLEIVELLDRRDDEVWHEDVKIFSVKDLVDASFVGHLYMDLYPREGKYKHAANFTIRPVSGIFQTRRQKSRNGHLENTLSVCQELMLMLGW